MTTEQLHQTAHEVVKLHSSSVSMTCDLLGIKRSTFYEKESRTPSQRDQENQELREQILRIWKNSKKRYGAPKIRIRLNEKRAKKKLGAVGINRVQRLMRELGIHSISKKKYKHHTSKANHDPNLKDLIGRDFKASTPFEKLVSDITYIHTARHGWCYLAVIMDVYSKAVIGWSFSKKMDAQLTSDALKKVIKKGLFHRGTILHSDRGSQYTAHVYRALAKKHGFQQSFSARYFSRKLSCFLLDFFCANRIKSDIIYVIPVFNLS